MKKFIPGAVLELPSSSRLARAGLLLLGALLLGNSAAYALAPPALTSIGNAASASFIDARGNASIVTSNPVVSVVQQVGAFLLDDVTGATTTTLTTKAVPAGGTIYSPHVITSTGNGPDSFNITVDSTNKAVSKIEIYADDGTGNPIGAALCTSLGGASCVLATPVSVAGSNGTFKFVVAYTVPATATSTAQPFDTSTLTVAPVAGSSPLYAVKVASGRDVINLATAAAFVMSKSIAVPAVSAPGGGAWPAASVGSKASTSATCPTNWSATLASSATCTYTVYTLTVSNIGVTAGHFAMSDTLPPGLTYVTGSAVWSSAPGVALAEGPAGDPVGIDYAYSNGKLVAVIPALGSNVTQTLSFVVLVNNSATAGAASTTNVAFYNPLDAGGSATSLVPGPLPTGTGTTPFTVNGFYRLALGSQASTSTTAVDSVSGTPNANANDTTTVASAVSGSIVKFEQRVYNTGDTTDTVNLVVSPGNFPAGTNFFLFAADGSTPLFDTGVLDNVVDTGPIRAGSSAVVVLAAFLPVGLPIGAVNYSAILTGTSHADPTQRDTTRDSLAAIAAGPLDLTNTPSGNGVAGATGNGDMGPGPSPSPTTINTTNAGVATGFNLYLLNNDVSSRSYSLAASASPTFPGNLPQNWTVKFVAGANNACLPTTPGISDSGVVASGAQGAVTACVTPAPTQIPVTAVKIYFKATTTTASATGVFFSDTKTDGVTVVPSTAASYASALTGNSVGQLPSPGTLVYSHVLANTGLLACGPYTLQVAFSPAEVAAGWTYAIYLSAEGLGQIGPNDTLVTGQITTPLLPGPDHIQKILVRIGAPAGLSIGSSSSAKLTAVFAAPNSCGSPSVSDLSTIGSAAIRVTKFQAIDLTCDGVSDVPPTSGALSVKPGNCIYYHVQAINEGVAAVQNLVVNDRAPAYTTLSATQPSVRCISTNVTGASVVYSASGAEVSCGSAINVVSPGGTVSLDYTVVVDH